MIYKAIGLISESSLDGLDIVYAHYQETGGKWNFEILNCSCYPYSEEWSEKLRMANTLSALDYQLLHTAYGHYVGAKVNEFIENFNLQHKVDLIASHGHPGFHIPEKKMTAQLGDGAAIAGVTGLPVVSDLRAMDLALGGQGAPIVAIGEKWLFPDYNLFLNLGGTATLSGRSGDTFIAFDICNANEIMNLHAALDGKTHDGYGNMAAQVTIDQTLLQELNSLEYYTRRYPKSLPDNFGTQTILPVIEKYRLPVADALRTYTEHIALQISASLSIILEEKKLSLSGNIGRRLFITGRGALNTLLITRLQELLDQLQVEVIIPGSSLLQYKEALIIGLMGVLRWREEYNVLSSVTGSSRNSIGGALWLGVEA